MSEYQYYEFQAVDRPLSKDEMAELRALSTRATITPTRFQNVYNWGDFRGDPEELMERYFDAFVYVANWGTHQLMLRLPRRLLDPDIARHYCVERGLDVRTKGDWVILDFTSNDEEGADWVDDEEAEGWLPSLLPLRDDLASGDLRSLYLAWLAGVQSEWLPEEDEENGEDEDDGELGPAVEADGTLEPPVPPGLGRLSASLKALADFLRIDEDLLAVAAKRSARPAAEPSASEIEQWVRDLPEAEKVQFLVRLVEGREPRLGAELRLRFRRATTAGAVGLSDGEDRRTVGQLVAAAREHAEVRRRAEAARAAEERARREQEAAAARAKHLASLVGHEEELWREAEALIEIKQAKPYDQAVELIRDLRDLAARSEAMPAFNARLDALCVRHAKKVTFIERLNRAELRRT